jgi:hypothetical protein
MNGIVMLSSCIVGAKSQQISAKIAKTHDAALKGFIAYSSKCQTPSGCQVSGKGLQALGGQVRPLIIHDTVKVMNSRRQAAPVWVVGSGMQNQEGTRCPGLALLPGS